MSEEVIQESSQVEEEPIPDENHDQVEQPADETVKPEEKTNEPPSPFMIVIMILIFIAAVVAGYFEITDHLRVIRGEKPIHKWTNAYRRHHKLQQLKVLAQHGMLDEHDLADLETNRP